MPKRISILGSTGSIGRNALEVVRRHPGQFEVTALAARGNVALLREQIEEFHPEWTAVYDENAACALREICSNTQIVSGKTGLVETASQPVDIALCAVVGAVGLEPLLAAIDAGNRVAIANKEPLVMAGHHVMEQAQLLGVDVLPVDSEHNAIYQCLACGAHDEVRCIHLTASGGPFYGAPRETLENITPAQAMRHPTWAMGAKISVDSATLMNKGLEIIEAMWLFGLRSQQIEVVIHPQSTVHSMVEFQDGSIIAQLGVTDMKIPITFALTWPERWPAETMRLDLTALSGLTFAKPDCNAFPCLALARWAAEQGGCAPAILNAANEEAVAAFCSGRIGFLDIARVVETTLEHCPASSAYRLEAVLDADDHARRCASSLIETLGKK